MQIPYEVQARPDTGLYNAKLGIWLFLASEVMLFGGLFSAYIFLRIGSDEGYWPKGLLNVPIGTFNTIVLIASSVTVILAWMALKMRRFNDYKRWMGITILCGAAFLLIKLVFEWPPKFSHFGAFIRKDQQEHYEKFLGNEHMRAHKLPPRNEISGHLEAVEFTFGGKDIEVVKAFAQRKGCVIEEAAAHGEHAAANTHTPAAPTATTAPATDAAAAPAPGAPSAAAAAEHAGTMYVMQAKQHDKGFWPSVAKDLQKIQGVKLVAFEVKPDPMNENPLDPENEKPHFIPKTPNHDAAPIRIEAQHVDHWSSFTPQHSTYFSTYFMITGLHGLHVLGGVLVFAFLWGPGAALYKKNPEHLANRVEVAGLFWHFVDLIWIFVFPLFYLL